MCELFHSNLVSQITESGQINVHQAIIEAFENGPHNFTRYEEHNVESFNEMIKKVNVQKSDKDILNEAITKASAVNETNQDGTTKSLPYEYQKLASRYSANLPIFGLSKDLKMEVYSKKNGYESFDVVNRNYSIIIEIAKHNRITNLPTIRNFVENYKTICNEYNSYWGNKDEVKKRFAQLVYHPENEQEDKREFVKQLVKEIQYVNENLKKHQERSLLQMIEIYSTFIINCVYEYLVEHGIIKNEHCSLGNNIIYFKPLKAFEKEKEKVNIETYIFEKTTLNIRLH